MVALIWHRVRPFIFSIFSFVSFLRLGGVGWQTAPPDLSAISSFFFSPQSTSFFLERPLLLVVGAVSALAAISAYRKRNDAFTSISTDISIYFEKEDGSKVRMTRKQKVRANHPNVSAYFTTIDAGRHGTVPPGEVSGWARTHKREPLNAKLEILGDEKKCDIIQICEPSFPFNWSLDLLPDFLRRDFIEREITTVHYGCFQEEEDYYEVLTDRYPNTAVTINVHFDPNRKPKEVRGQRIKANGVISTPSVMTDDRGTELYTVSFLNSTKERLRISWKMS